MRSSARMLLRWCYNAAHKNSSTGNWIYGQLSTCRMTEKRCYELSAYCVSDKYKNDRTVKQWSRLTTEVKMLLRPDITRNMHAETDRPAWRGFSEHEGWVKWGQTWWHAHWLKTPSVQGSCRGLNEQALYRTSTRILSSIAPTFVARNWNWDGSQRDVRCCTVGWEEQATACKPRVASRTLSVSDYV